MGGRWPEEVRDFDIESVSVGQTIRIKHEECSAHKYDKTLSLTRQHDGIIYHCYRCGISGFRSSTMNPDIAQRYLQSRNLTLNEIKSSKVTLPYDFHPMCDKPNKIPAKAYAWLYQYELDDNDLCNYNIGYSSRLNRVVLPIYHKYELVGWVGRDINYTKGYKGQKYHNEFKGGGRVFFITDSDNNTIGNSDPQSWIFVEDILSAIKCRKATGHTCVALLNTSVGDNDIRSLMEGHINYLWLDPDARVKSLKQVFKYRQQGIDITTVNTNEDPKSVPLSEIPSWLTR